MSRTDNDLPWRFLEEDRPELRWDRILNTRSKWKGAKKRAKQRSWWKGERHRVRMAMMNGDERPGKCSPHRVRPNLW